MAATAPLDSFPSNLPVRGRVAPLLLRSLVIAAVLWSSLNFARTAIGQDKTTTRPNVLFIVADDLNHWVGHLGRNKQTKTPNIDRLAKRGVAFTHAYCAAPLCNPSRAALLSGLRPSTTGVYDNDQDFRPAIATDITLTTQFLRMGYRVFGAGKIFHGPHRSPEWTSYFVRKASTTKQKTHPSAKVDGVGGIRFKPLENDSILPDEVFVDYAIGQLKEKHKEPFFLAVGLAKPHLPWDVHKKYYDRFPLDTIELPPMKKGILDELPPAGVKMALRMDDHKKMLDSGRWKEAIQAYLATIAFTDDQIGRLLDALDNSEYASNTIVVFFGDHGWHLGEKEHWRKFTLWEEGTRTPFIWIAPGITKAGGVCERTVDHMSIYPTLCDLCGIAIPKHVEGKSIRPLLADPAAKWDLPALITYHRNNHAVRTEKWRYIRYADGGEELYDHTKDPYEWTNLARDKNYREVMVELARHMPVVNAPEQPKIKAKE